MCLVFSLEIPKRELRPETFQSNQLVNCSHLALADYLTETSWFIKTGTDSVSFEPSCMSVAHILNSKQHNHLLCL